MTKPRALPVSDVPWRRRAKAGSIKVLLGVASHGRQRAKLGRERVAALKTWPLSGGEVFGILAKARTLGRLSVIDGRGKKKGDWAARQEEIEE